MIGSVALASCTTAPVPTEPDSYADQITAVIEEAEAGGASEAQMAILLQAQSQGEMSLEGARAAAHAVVDCIYDAGSTASYQERTTGAGLILPGGSALTNTPEELAIVDACAAQENHWVDYLYQTQPTSKALEDAFLEEQVPFVRSCLESTGNAVATDATTREVLLQAVDVALETEWGVDCLTPFGIEGI